jgi:hypothetical protein
MGLAVMLMGLAVPHTLVAKEALPAGPFRSVTLQSGGEVIVRYGPSHRVTVLQGSAECVSARVDDADRLVIEHRHRECEKNPRLIIEAVTPEVGHLLVSNGGMIRCAGGFPAQEGLRVAVDNGGVIDVRSMRADQVTAAVYSGGRIFTRPQKSLRADIAQGGIVTYWGNPHVQSKIDHGGVVTRGKPSEVDKPVSGLTPGSDIPPLPALPPVPPSPPTRSGSQ